MHATIDLYLANSINIILCSGIKWIVVWQQGASYCSDLTDHSLWNKHRQSHRTEMEVAGCRDVFHVSFLFTFIYRICKKIAKKNVRESLCAHLKIKQEWSTWDDEAVYRARIGPCNATIRNNVC